jgi:SNF2 family DNA or RNA helicase
MALELLPHQKVAVEKFRGIPAVFIGDSMGVGKTLTGVQRDLDIRAAWTPSQKDSHFRTLIVCQKGGLSVWRWHLEQMGVSPNRILVVDPSDRTRFNTELELGALNFDYYIVHWNALALLSGLMVPKNWHHVIADEVQYAKNPKTKRTREFKKIPCTFRTAISGTPADDKPQDFWSPLNWLYKKQFSSYWRFYNKYLKWHTHPHGYRIIDGVQNIGELHDLIRPFYIRRTLTEVIDDMPEKTHSTIRVEMTKRQRRDYNAMEKYQVSRLGDREEELVVTHKIAMYMRLLQMTMGTCELDWSLVEEGKRDSPVVRINEPSPKIDALMELIEEHPEEQFVVFTNFRDVVGMVLDRCKKEKISTSHITGSVLSQAARDAAVADFQSGKARVFVGTVKAAGTTITLTAAHTLVFLDRNWNPSVNEQAEDRIWRIGQKNACQIIDIIAEDTVDEPRLKKIWQKAQAVKDVVNVK